MSYNYLSIFFILLITASCRKKEPIVIENTKIGGCIDVDSPLNNTEFDFDNGSCKYAYVNEIQLLGFPEKDDGSSWDSFGGRADVYIKFKPVSSVSYTGFFDVESNEVENARHNEIHTWAVPAFFKLTGEEWTWAVYDKDGTFGGSDDEIASGTVNPIEIFDIQNNSVILSSTNGETQIKVNTIIQ